MKIILTIITIFVLGLTIYTSIQTNPSVDIKSNNQYTGPNPQNYVIR